MNKGVVIIGAGGHGQVVADALLVMQRAGQSLEPVGFIDENRELHGQLRLGLPILGGMDQLEEIEFDQFVVGIGHNGVRKTLFDRLIRKGCEPATILHPTAIIAPNVSLGAGTMIMAGAVVNTGSVVGRNVILNSGSIIEHHNRIGDHCHIAPGVTLGGEVKIGHGSLIGIGSTVLPRVTVGPCATVGGGAVVTRPVNDGQTVVGIPARALDIR